MDGNLHALGRHLDEQDANEQAYEENQRDFNDAVNDELSKEISLMLSAKNDILREELYMEIEDEFNLLIRRFDVEQVTLSDWISEFHEENKKAKTTRLEFKNTQNIDEWGKMCPFTTPVSNFIEAFNLPSYSYPEVYEYFVVQMGLEAIEDEEKNLVFDWGNNFRNCSLENIYTLIDNIKELDDSKMLYFQVKNSVKEAKNRNAQKRENPKKSDTAENPNPKGGL